MDNAEHDPMLDDMDDASSSAGAPPTQDMPPQLPEELIYMTHIYLCSVAQTSKARTLFGLRFSSVALLF